MSGMESALIKKAYQKVTYTDKQIQAFALCSDLDTGPQYFMRNFFYIQHPVKGKMQFEPFDYQDELIDVYRNNRFSINMLARQLGKCLTADINITVKNKTTGQVYDIPIGKFYEYQAAIKEGKSYSIDEYKRKDV